MAEASAKTGSLQGVYNLAGFITTASGQKIAFVQYLSGYAIATSQITQSTYSTRALRKSVCQRFVSNNLDKGPHHMRPFKNCSKLTFVDEFDAFFVVFVPIIIPIFVVFHFDFRFFRV